MNTLKDPHGFAEYVIITPRVADTREQGKEKARELVALLKYFDIPLTPVFVHNGTVETFEAVGVSSKEGQNQ